MRGTVSPQTLALSSGTLAVGRAHVGNEQQGQGVSAQRSSGRKGSDEAPKVRPPAEAPAPPEKGTKSPTTACPDAACATNSSFPAASKRQRHRAEPEETPEQLVAVARGGVRYAGKVFHRRGVKLTEDSPRSMIPRDVSVDLVFSLSVVYGLMLSGLLGCCKPRKALAGRIARALRLWLSLGWPLKEGKQADAAVSSVLR